MKLEHLLQAYKKNNIETKLKEINSNNERAGIITFGNGIAASYLLDNEDIVIAMKIFFNCISRNNSKAEEQISHTTKIIAIIQNTIMLLSNISHIECNMILDKLGLFDYTFKQGKQIKHLEHEYKIEVIEGILCLSINEIESMKG
jgi:hypothetical protein